MSLDKQRSWIREFPNRRFQTQLVGADFVPHQREFHILVLLNKGEVELEYRTHCFRLFSGDAILIPAGEIYSFVTCNEQPAQGTFHYIDTVEAIRASNGFLLSNISNILATKAALAPYLTRIFSNLAIPLSKQQYADWLSELMIALTNNLPNLKKVSFQDFDSLIAAKDYIQKNIEHSLSLDDIACQFDMDKWQLSRKFKPTFGFSLFQHFHASRMVKAKALLSQKQPICDVALRLGYSDQSHFTRFFKRFVGISPNTWVKLVTSVESQQVIA